VETALRVYRIRPGELDAFVAEWRAAIVPLRRRFGFTVEAAWTSRETDTFVWLLRYDGADDWETANAAYYDSPERAAFDPDPARLIVDTTELRLEPVDVSR
jgi:NIPSNAP